jgi:hypothetical protein
MNAGNAEGDDSKFTSAFSIQHSELLGGTLSLLTEARVGTTARG